MNERLRARVKKDLRPVRPLLLPWQRAALLAPAALLAAAAAPAVLGVRGDLAQVGPWLAWGASAVQLVVAVMLIGASLREAVPAQMVPRSTAAWLLAAGAATTALLAVTTNVVSPEPAVRAETFQAWAFCWERAVLFGAPLFLAILVFIARGLPARPELAGSLAGMGAGAAVDGGWRLYCNYSAPSHVIGSHGGAVLALTLIGVFAGVIVREVSNRRIRRGKQAQQRRVT
jgi:hypothetical protein